jgi:NADH dehydrogenase FAD-containing subunit
MFYLQYFMDTLQSICLKNKNDKQNVLLLGDGFFARGFLHTIDYKKYDITQIYRDEFINPQDLFYSLQRNKIFDSHKQYHIKDKIQYFFNKKSIKKVNEHIDTLHLSDNNAIINNKLFYFDYMVIGLGSQKSLKNWTDELNYLIKEKNKQIDIIGAGPVGFEIAMMLNKFNKINIYDVLTEDKIFSYVNKYNKNYLLNLLDKKNITLNLGGFYNSTDEKNKDNYKIFCVGTRPNNLTQNIIVNDKLQTERNNVYIGGDCVGVNNKYGNIKNAQVAYQQGVYVAKRLNKEIDENEQFKYISKGMALNIDDKQILVENNDILPNGIYPDYITHMYSIFCV